MGQRPAPAWGSFAEWLARGDYALFVAETRLPAGAPARMLLVRHPAGRFENPATLDVTVHLATDAPPGAVSRCDLGAGRFTVPMRGGAVVLPRATATGFDVSAPSEILVASLSAPPVMSALRETSSGRLSDHGALHAADQRDPVLEGLLRRLWAEAADDGMGLLLAEDAAAAIAACLARLALRANGLPGAEGKQAPPLHGPRLARVLALIEDELAGDLRQAAMADAAGLSPWHFCRAFRAATGVAPHRFVLLRRLARAQRLMRSTGDSLAGIAAACGFADQAHLSNAFAREVGISPKRWRVAARA